MWINSMSSMPKITVIIPTYNRGNLIHEAIFSVLKQEWIRELFEVDLIIVDDASTDNTSAIVQEIINQEVGNISYSVLSQNSWWPAKPRNIWISLIHTSDYIFFLDSDDLLKESCFKTCLSFLNIQETCYGVYFYCENEYSQTIGYKKNIFQERDYRNVSYEEYLSGFLGFELGLFLRWTYFIEHPHFRFDETIISEGVLRSQLHKYCHEQKMNFSLLDYIGRVYRQHHVSQKRIVQTVSTERFLKNAEWNRKLLEIQQNDLYKYGKKPLLAKYNSHIWINYLLAWPKRHTEWVKYLYKAYQLHKSIYYLLLFLISKYCNSLLRWLYKLFIYYK